MLDKELLVQALRKRGHTVESVISVPENAGDYEFMVDGELLSLDEVRALMEADDAR
ncbi:MAG TPA: hypothetical protein VM865_05465 [Acidobacteriaceae bacterium]|jgi:hypothetical protein|nr:hypothetical protein [Acidobacteriaceae bacterium]